jgi:hypothetical protein
LPALPARTPPDDRSFRHRLRTGLLGGERFACAKHHGGTADQSMRLADETVDLLAPFNAGGRIAAMDQPVAIADRRAALASRPLAHLNLRFRDF